MINEIIATYTSAYFIRQILTIIGLLILGLAITYSLGRNKNTSDGDNLKQVLVFSFPVGLGMFIFVGYTMITFGIPYRGNIILLILLLILCICILRVIKSNRLTLLKKDLKLILLFIIACVILSIVAVSGLISISVSNDSLYYFWQYPRAIVLYGGIRDQFDNFLTDTGLGAAVIGTAPFLFGFGETFGIQEFFHMNFILFFGNAIYSGIKNHYKNIDDKKAGVIAMLGMALLVVCTPAYVLSHWAMANMYFMEYFFIALSLAGGIAKNYCMNSYCILSVVLFACAFLRMEGGIFILLLLLICSLVGVDKKKLVISVIPILVLQSIYEIRIFTTFIIDNPYTFMTKDKALIQFVAYLLVIIYILFIKDWLAKRIGNKGITLIYIGTLVLVNIALLIFDKQHYINNLKAFVGNLFGQSGWGMLPYITIGAIVIIFVWELVLDRKKGRMQELIQVDKKEVAYWLFAFWGFLLVALAVSFARGDDLNINTGDSGNRVMLQIAPIVLMLFIYWFVDLLTRGDNGTKR